MASSSSLQSSSVTWKVDKRIKRPRWTKGIMQKIRWCDRWTGEKKDTDLFCLQLWYTWAWSSGNITVTTGCGQRDPWWLCGQEEGWEGGGERDTEPEWGRASNDSMRNPCTGDKTEITCLGTSWLSAITQILSIYSFLSLYLKKWKTSYAYCLCK